MSSDGMRSLQHAVAVSDRVKCVEWMAVTAALHGEKGFPAKAIEAFPAYFRSDVRRVNPNKARDWWSKRHALVQPEGERQRKFARSGSVTPRRIQDFADRHDIVYRRLKGKKQVSSEKQRVIHASVAEYLGRLKRQFDDGLIDPTTWMKMMARIYFRGAFHVKYRAWFLMLALVATGKSFSLTETYRTSYAEFQDEFKKGYAEAK
ncbi:hypothetical protein PInf_010461 [Phytophthora infestans]|nr:hypothetical protein PInf_010461 [Phytophthora infestans]